MLIYNTNFTDGGRIRKRKKSNNLILIFIIILFIGFLIVIFTTNSSTPTMVTNNQTNANSSSTIKTGNSDELNKYKNSGCISDKMWYIKSNKNEDNIKYNIELYNSTANSKNGKWCILPGYISNNGKENVNWKYTENPNDNECMKNWTYYNPDGTIIEKNIPNITKLRDNKNWCPLNVYLFNEYKIKDNNVNLNEMELLPIGENKIWKYLN